MPIETENEKTFDTLRGNPLNVAQKLGHSIALELGAEAFIELQLSYATRLLPKFVDNPIIRVRQNLLLHWDQSYLKSTIIDEFEKTIPDSMIVADITSMSPQMIFGSISENRKNIIKPAFAHAHFTKITELLSFLGTGNTMKDIVNTMNKVMEGERVTRQLLKLGQIDFDVTKIEKLNQEGIRYDPHLAQIQYRPDICVWSASRPMPNRTYTYLRSSGHLYRYHVLQHQISDEEAKKFFTEEIRPNLELQKYLKLLNERLAKVAVKRLEMLTKPILDQIFSPLEDIAKDEIGERKIRLATILDVRTKGDVVRELASHAFLRTASQNGFQNIGTLEYTDEDVAFLLRDVGHFIEFKIDPLFVEDFSIRVTRKRPREQVKEIILELLQSGEIAGRSDIDEHVLEEMTVSIATISNALADLLQENKIQQPKFGLYRRAEK